MQLSKKCMNEHEEKKGRDESNFYMTINNNLFKSKKVHICKDCLKEFVYKENGDVDLIKFKKVLQLLDMPFYQREFESSVSDKKDTFGCYYKNIALNYKGKGWCDGELEVLTQNIRDTFVDETPAYSSEWKGTFTGSQIIALNQYYKDLKDDFNILTTNHKDYARKVAKASLLVDIEYDKLMQGNGSSKAYKDAKDIFDTLCNSAQFAESRRNKTDASNGIADITDSVEDKTWIYEVEEFPPDSMDKLLDQFKSIDKSL